ncbi:MAG: zf-TFIIB domain-containing protein [Deltaproteobacteria bacterium]|nr:zf-TFIIB domain-containing protein [Deltaproteobacteria bacterium]
MTVAKPSQTEEEYFARLEAEKLKKQAAKKKEALSQAEQEKLKKLHWMRCPKCGMELHSMVYKGIVIDKCFHCHGIFLDDGELEKIAGGEGGFVNAVLGLFKTS